MNGLEKLKITTLDSIRASTKRCSTVKSTPRWLRIRVTNGDILEPYPPIRHRSALSISLDQSGRGASSTGSCFTNTQLQLKH